MQVEWSMILLGKQPYISHGQALNNPIYWEFACSNGCHLVSPTHVLFHELP